MAIRYKRDEQTQEQQYRKLRYKAIQELARSAGFDEQAFEQTEFSLMPFFELIVEQCALAAEEQSRNYTGEHREDVGCQGAAAAIRAFGRNIGNI